MDDIHEVVSKLEAIVKEWTARQMLLARAIKTFRKQSISSDPFAINLWLKSNINIMPESAPALQDIDGEIKAACKDLVMRFDADFREAASTEKWSLSGQWPKYYVDYIITVNVDEKQWTVYVEEEKIETLFVPRIVDCLKSQLKSVRPELSKLPGFLKELYSAYSGLASAENRTVSIWAVYKEMVIKRQPNQLWRDAKATRFRPYSQLEFKASFTELLKTNLSSCDGWQLRLHPPISKDESLYIYQPAEHRFAHVGRIEFVQDRG